MSAMRQLPEIYTQPIARATIGDQLRRLAANQGEKVAVVTYSATGERSAWTYGRLNALANRWANALAGWGVGRGDKVVAMSRNRIDIIGAYFGALKLLQAGAHVIVTTRFPRDAALRYAREPDYESFRDRLEIHGLDLRHTPSVESLAAHLVRSHARLDFIVHNACQTVRRPPGFYRHLLAEEVSDVPAALRPYLGGLETLRA